MLLSLVIHSSGTEKFIRSSAKAYGRKGQLYGMQEGNSGEGLSIGRSLDSELPTKSEWFQELVGRSRDLMAVTDFEGGLLFLNSFGKVLLGVEPESTICDLCLLDRFDDGRTLLDHIILPTIVKNGAWESDSHLLYSFSGETFPVAVRAALILGDPARDSSEIAWTIRDRRVRHELSRQIGQRVQEHRVVADLARQAQKLRWLDLLRNAVAAVAGTLGADLVVIAQPIEGSEKLHIVARHDNVAMNLNILNGGTRSQSGYTVLTGKPVISLDIALETRFDTSSSRRYGMVSGIGVPIPQDGEPWGALSLHTLDRREFTEDDVSFLEAVASVLSSAQKRIGVERELRHLSLHDPLTGLPNRALVQDRIEHGLRMIKGKTDENLMAVLLLDLDNFQAVNDTLGHDNGDQLLVDLVPRLYQAVHEGDTVSRLGGDEFLIVCEDVKSPFEAFDLANRLRNTWSEPFQVDERSVFLSGSIGITVAKHGSQPLQLIREADTAMYRAKQSGIGGIELYEPMMGEASSDRFHLATDLHTAIEQDQLWLAYQPIVELATGRIAAVEALCRWDHPTKGEIKPEVFIKLAEETGQIGALGSWVLETACRSAVSWQRIAPSIRLRVNVSALQIKDDGFIKDVSGILQRTKFSPHLLGLELTESVILEYGDTTRETLSQLRELGLELLIDDYGTGYSSLGYLVRFQQMSALKIDSEFIQLAVDERREAIILSIVALGHALGMKVVAEGVESQEQLDCVRLAGCDYVQGYLLGRPVIAEELMTLLQL